MAGWFRYGAAGLIAAGVAGCSERSAPVSVETSDAVETTAGVTETETALEWPSSLRTMGDGYPTPGAPCRRVGETAATADFLDHTAVLVACPGGPDATAAKAITTIAGRAVSQVDGFTLISIPAAQFGRSGAPMPGAPGQDDTPVPGASFEVTGTVLCARDAGQPTSACKFGVARPAQGAVDRRTGLTVFWPGGGSRVIFFDKQGKAVGFDANEADGSAHSRLTARRNPGLTVVSIGEERYEVPDTVIKGE